MVITDSAAKPVRALGDFFAMSLDTFVQMFRPPWAWREFLGRREVLRDGLRRLRVDTQATVRPPRGRDPYLVGAGVIMVGLLGAFLFSVSVQDVTPGAFAASLTLLVGSPEVIIATVTAMWFGLAAALIACYTGRTVVSATRGVGTAVNRTVAYPFVALFVIKAFATLPHEKSRKRRSASAHSDWWAEHLGYVRQTRPQGGTLNSVSPVSKRSAI